MKNKLNIPVSAEFQAGIYKAIFAIALFIITYLLIVAVSISLFIGCVYLAINIISFKINYFSIILGLALIGTGLTVIWFVLKFLMNNKKIDRSHLIEITSKDEPELVAMIHSLANEVGTTKPKHIYLSSQINASVFYDSNFWSMFLPIKKNLEIGIGLVNTLTRDELKAVVAHEFGHFSQKSMTIGSYVYNMNKIMHDMLYENDSFNDMMHKVSSANGFLQLGVMLATTIEKGMQWILLQSYKVMNKANMLLSREMEFNADAIAASVTGYEPIESSLLRTQIGSNALDETIDYFNSKIEQNITTNNIFIHQMQTMHYLAEVYSLQIEHNLPKVELADAASQKNSKLIYNDLWESHPSTEDRISRVKATGFIAKNEDFASANTYFKNIGEWQELFTTRMFASVEYSNTPEIISIEAFAEDLKSRNKSTFDNAVFKNYYANRGISSFSIPLIENNAVSYSFEELISDEKIDLIRQSEQLANDSATIQAIIDKNISVNRLQYDSKIYKVKEAKSLLKSLTKERESIEKMLLENDQNLFLYFLQLEKKFKSTEDLKAMYNHFFSANDRLQEAVNLHDEAMQQLHFINYRLDPDSIHSNFAEFTPLETKIKEKITALLNEEVVTREFSQSQIQSLKEYISKKWLYFERDNYNMKLIDFLFENLNHFIQINYKIANHKCLQILEYQKELLELSQALKVEVATADNL